MLASRALAHDPQLEILDDPRRFCLVLAGRQWGKTELGFCKLLDSARQRIGTCFHISPSIDMAKQAHERARGLSPGWKHVKRTTYACNGSRVICLTQQEACNIDHWRGHSISGIVVDEPWMCDSRLAEAICFHLSACPAWLLLAGTPPWNRRKWLKRSRLAARLAAVRLGFDPSDVAVYLRSTESGLNVSQAVLQEWRASLSPDLFDAETLNDYA